jgi:hypothetical protein
MARRHHNLWAPTAPMEMPELPSCPWRAELPTGEATELSFEDGMALFRQAVRMQEEPDDINDDFVERTQ